MEYDPRLGARHRVRDHSRIHHRHRAIVDELDRRGERHSLCRDRAQSAPASAIVRVVFCGDDGAPARDRKPVAALRRHAQSARSLSAGTSLRAGHVVGVGGSPSRRHRVRRRGELGTSATTGDRTSFSGAARKPCAGDRLAAADLPRHGAAVVVRSAASGPLQRRRRHGYFAGTCGAPGGAHRLHGRASSPRSSEAGLPACRVASAKPLPRLA